MSNVNDWNLFGLDLSTLVARVRLGCNQILWSEEVGLCKWLCPPIKLLSLTDLEVAGNDLADNLNSERDEEFLGIELEPLKTLTRSISVPVQAEVHLQEILSGEVSAVSPFPETDTVWGARVVSRTPSALQADLVIARRADVDAATRTAGNALAHSYENLEVWGAGDHGPVRFELPANSRRVDRYYRVALRRGASILLSFAVVLLMIAIPSFWLASNASQMEQLLSSTIMDTQEAVKSRDRANELLDQRSRLNLFLSDQVSYAPLLHQISFLTPDSAYLNRLSLEGARITALGLAENAAEYQGILANSGLFAEVTAPTAFTRDARLAKERFNLSMRLANPAESDL